MQPAASASGSVWPLRYDVRMVEIPKELVSAALGAAATAAGKEVIGAVLVPPAKEVGDVLGRAVHVALTPIRAGLWPIEKVIEWAETEIPKRLKGVPSERIQSPTPEVFVPALLAMTYTKAEDLRSMFAALLAKSMDSATAGDVHPSFVEVIKQLTTDEAKILAAIGDGADFYTVGTATDKAENDEILLNAESDLFERAGCARPKDDLVALGNLQRLNLVKFGGSARMGATNVELAARHISSPGILEKLQKLDPKGVGLVISKNLLQLTVFGHSFCACCIDEPAAAPTASPGT